MKLRGRKNQIPANATATRRITGQAAGLITEMSCWHPSLLVSFGLTPSVSANSLMRRDKGQSTEATERFVGGYLFNKHF